MNRSSKLSSLLALSLLLYLNDKLERTLPFKII
jgi:hypothetical protein